MMRTTQILSVFPKITVLVAGDIRLDRRSVYDPSLSGPGRLATVSTNVAPGAGGAIASSLTALGAYRVAVLGVVGDDGFGLELIRALDARGIGHELTVKAAGVPTCARTRFINAETGAEDRQRIDTLRAQPLPAEVERKVLTRFESAVGAFDVIIVADDADAEGGGVVTPAMRSLLRDLAARLPRKVIWVDSPRRMEDFRRTAVRTTQRHADEVCRKLFGAVDYQRLREHIGSRLLVIDQSPRGALVVEPDSEILAETDPAEAAFEAAGDSFSGAAAVALAATRSGIDAAQFGNLVASVAIRKTGLAAASPEEVLLAAGG